MNENVAGAFCIRRDRRDLRTDLQLDRAVAQGGLEMQEGTFNQRRGFDRRTLQMNFASFEASHFGGFFDEVIEAVALFIDDGEKFELVGVPFGGRSEKVRDRSFHAG